MSKMRVLIVAEIKETHAWFYSATLAFVRVVTVSYQVGLCLFLVWSTIGSRFDHDRRVATVDCSYVDLMWTVPQRYCPVSYDTSTIDVYGRVSTSMRRQSSVLKLFVYTCHS